MTDTKALRGLLAKHPNFRLPLYVVDDAGEYIVVTPDHSNVAVGKSHAVRAEAAATLIVKFVNALPALLDEVEALRKLVAEREAQLTVALTEPTLDEANASASLMSALAMLRRLQPDNVRAAQCQRAVDAIDRWKSHSGKARADALARAFRDGADAMREAAAKLGDHNTYEAMKVATAAESHRADTVALRAYAAAQAIREYADAIRALPLPEDK